MASKRQRGYEGSKADKAKDKREAKKRGIPVKRFEGSKADNRMDRLAKRLAGRAL